MKYIGIAIWGLLFFLLVELFIFVPLFLLGIPVAFLADRYAKKVVVPSRLYPERDIICYQNKILDAWVGNWEDGITPVFDWWKGSTMAWYFRNPVCNLRFCPVISTKPSPFTRYIGTDHVPEAREPGHFLAWSGVYVCYLYQNAKWGIWIGWKINPRDSRYILPDDYRNWGVGTACQLMRY